MSRHSAVHFYLSWAKERIDEMDATLASFEAKVSEVQARLPRQSQSSSR